LPHSSYDIFRRPSDGYRPPTAGSALRALGADLAPKELFIYRATSAKPLDEEPVDLEAIERILSRPDLDVETNIMLMDLFQRLVKNPDSEVALFAAESINTIENRYNRSIEKLKSSTSPDKESRLARLYYELSLLHEESPSLKKFYLREAFSHLHALEKDAELEKKDVGLLVHVLLDLNLEEHAEHSLKKYAREEDPFTLLLQAEIAFRRRDFIRVLQVTTELSQYLDELDEAGRLVLATWLEI
jgi:hypothetical protein